MKKISLTLTALLIAVTLTACGSESSSNHKDTKKGTEVTTEKEKTKTNKNNVEKNKNDISKQQDNNSQSKSSNVNSTDDDQQQSNRIKKDRDISADEVVALANKYFPTASLPENYGPYTITGSTKDGDTIKVQTKELEFPAPNTESNDPQKCYFFVLATPIENNQIKLQEGMWSSIDASHMYDTKTVSRN